MCAWYKYKVWYEWCFKTHCLLVLSCVLFLTILFIYILSVMFACHCNHTEWRCRLIIECDVIALCHDWSTRPQEIVRNRLTETTAFKAYLLRTMCMKLCTECNLIRLVVSTAQWLTCRKRSVGCLSSWRHQRCWELRCVEFNISKALRGRAVENRERATDVHSTAEDVVFIALL